MTDPIRTVIRMEMARRNWTQTRLADEIGISRQYINELLTGRAGKLPDSWSRIFDGLDLELRLVPKGE